MKKKQVKRDPNGLLVFFFFRFYSKFEVGQIEIFTDKKRKMSHVVEKSKKYRKKDIFLKN